MSSQLLTKREENKVFEVGVKSIKISGRRATISNMVAARQVARLN